jgi:Cu/Ag efflux protein CusF
MKTVLKATGAVLLTLIFTLLGAADTNEVAQAKSKKTVDTYPFAKGIIEKLDLAARRITVKTDRGPRAFDLTSRTYVFRGKEKLTLDKLKLGDSIKLNYYTNDLGQALIRRIKVDQPEPPQP